MSYSIEIKNVDEKTLPPFLSQKIALEENIVKNHYSLPHIDKNKTSSIVIDLSLLVEGLV